MKTKIKASPSTKREIGSLGTSIRRARLLRALPQTLIADRASISVQTLRRIERGDLGVNIGAYAFVLQALGLLRGWGDIHDEFGEILAPEQVRKRAPKRTPSGTRPGPPPKAG